MVREGWVPAGSARLFVREIGEGPAVIVVHGGPDFDHTYFLPELDRLSAWCRLIYYDQRGRGRSADGVRPEDVSLASEVADLETLRRYFRLDSVAVLGHSYGAILAMAYAMRHPGRVSHLLLVNSAPASHGDWMAFREQYVKDRADEVAAMQALAATPAFEAGDPDVVADRYRIHFRAACRETAHVERLIQRLRAAFTRDGILKARAIEDRLDAEVRLSPAFDLLPRLRQLNTPTLVLHGDSDLVPVECAARIAAAVPGARLVVLACGHFAYMERPEEFGEAVGRFLGSEETGA